MDKKTVKELAISLGTDLVGIAAVDRFADSPIGHSPIDKFPACKSVIVLGCTCREVCPQRFGFKQ